MRDKLSVRVLLCTLCHRYHRELPDFVTPFKHLCTKAIAAIHDGMLNPEATFDSVDWGHAYISVSLNGEGRIYGGAGTVRGHGITSDDITHFFDFSDENLSSITLENMLQIQKDYAETEEATEIPDDEYLTWQSIADTVGSNGAWAKIAGNYTYFYKANDFNYFKADDFRFGNSLYWGGSLSFLNDTWVDGRYINQYSLWEPNADLADHPDSAIALPDVTIPIVRYSDKNEYNQDTQQYESIYDVHDVKEIKMLVCFSFNSHKNCWIPYIDWKNLSDDIHYFTYETLEKMTQQGVIDPKYLEELTLTADEAEQIIFDRNTAEIPAQYYIYNGSAPAGTYYDAEAEQLAKRDLNVDETVSVADAVLLARFIAEDPTLPEQTICRIIEVKPDLHQDGLLTLLDLRVLLRELSS